MHAFATADMGHPFHELCIPAACHLLNRQWPVEHNQTKNRPSATPHACLALTSCSPFCTASSRRVRVEILGRSLW